MSEGIFFLKGSHEIFQKFDLFHQKFYIYTKFHPAPVAQRIEQRPSKPWVAGSSPAGRARSLTLGFWPP